MKEAAGEANLTVIAIILIGVIAAVVTPMINSYMTTSAKKGCCTNAGGYWVATGTGTTTNRCMYRDASGAEQPLAETSYWDATNKTCAG